MNKYKPTKTRSWHLIYLSAVFFMMFGGYTQAYSQEFIVKGVVTDAEGKPVAGVSVVLKDTDNGATTDEAGGYTLRLPSGNGTLVFRYVGFGTQEVPVNGRTTINVQLETSSEELSEVVVVGYGTQTKASITGAVSTIKSEDLVRTPAVAATSALVGKVPGVTARTTDSRPGNGANIQIRNLGNPLYVIDGVPYSTNDGTTSFGFNSGVSGQNIFNNLGLEDIESITVLKDASASVYGLRASNGVVLITTKKGRRNETTSINVTGYYGMQNFTRFPRPANAGQYIRGLLESAQNFGQDPALLYSPDQLAKWEAGTERGYQSYDYFDIVMRPNVPQYYLSANASGGSERSNYYISLSHINQDAIIRDFSFDRTNLQANVNGNLAKGLQVGTQISARVEKRLNVGVPGLDDYFNPLLSVFSMWPTESPYANDNPNYIHQTHNVNVNPATYRRDVTGYVDHWWRAMNVNLTAQYDFNFGLTAKGLYSYNFTNEDLDGFEYTYDAYLYDAETDTYFTRPGFGNQNPWREKHKRNIVARFAQFQLSYDKQFGDHSLSAVAAYERSDNENARNVIHTVPSNNYIPIMSFAEQDYLADEWAVEARAGYIGRVNYNYRQKYLVELLGRYDGSFLYASEHRWGFFPGISLGWRLSEERFAKDRFGGWLTDFKLRVSYGETGSEMGLSPFAYLAGFTYAGTGVNDGRNAVLDGNFVNGLRSRGLPITTLSWVTNQTRNVGLDFTVFGKLTGQFDLFERRRTGLPAARYDVLLPSEVGYTLPNENLNSDATRGMDGMISWRDQVGNVQYSIGVNGTLARLRSLSTYKPRFGNSYDEYRRSIEDRWTGVNAQGLATGINWGYQVVGQFQSQEEIDNHPINIDGQGNRTLLPGDLVFKDVNGDGIINDLDVTPIGYAEGAQPYINYGINGSIGWKGITLAFDFVGAGMQTFFRDWELKFPFQNNGNLLRLFAEDHWRREDPYDPNSAWIPGTYPALRKDLNTHVNYRRSDFWVTNVRYFRLRNLELGYAIPRGLLERVGISALRIFANGTNLFSLDNVGKFEIDPEIASTNGLVYPQQRLYTFGFNLSL
ncbi:TonB-dependent receptor [Parapedobacter sp. ISTM3]|uniref:SusC/RagA family TonB-linked outer membrane protein n=1 Tax=Parapedobacter sp. ISTM3 TaxID=2800130 RepID=UPI0019066027|nr:TonB-dependent receptor [Parapedobacter sp. ISTM3]MBK1441357.1 TonB-dependent receptor [Parapedobacter sp. ISTM3]